MSLLSMCNDTITLQRQTRNKDAAGGWVSTWADVSGMTDIPADIQPAESRTVVAYSQQQMMVSHTIFLSQDITAKATDRITSGGRYFKVHGYTPPGSRDEWPAKADCQEELTL